MEREVTVEEKDVVIIGDNNNLVKHSAVEGLDNNSFGLFFVTSCLFTQGLVTMGAVACVCIQYPQCTCKEKLNCQPVPAFKTLVKELVSKMLR